MIIKDFILKIVVIVLALLMMLAKYVVVSKSEDKRYACGSDKISIY